MRAREFLTEYRDRMFQYVKGVAEGGAETSWSDDADTITLQDILELTKHIKQINLPINDNLKSKLIHWDGNPEEIERINQVTVSNQFPILIIVDEQGQIKSILDGNHRLHKAIRSQAKTIPAKLIKPSNLNDKAKKIFGLNKQDLAEGTYDSETFNIKRRPLNVPLLIQKGAIFVTYPHGDDGWETDAKLDWQLSLITLLNVEQEPWCKEAPKYRKPASYKRAEQQINSSAPNLGNDQLVYDGKYNQILWSIQKLGIPEEQAFLDAVKENKMRAKDFIVEYRDRMYQYIKSVVPKFPDYVVKDWLYANFAKGATQGPGWSFDTIGKDIPNILKDMGLSVDTKWQLVPNVKFTMDMWEPKTLKRLQARAGGSSKSADPDVHIPTNDAERHATQAALVQQQGGVRKEPVIIIKTSKGYELLEGWHRTIQHFAANPQGYVGPAYVAQSTL